MLELKGKYNKDCKLFNDNIEDDATSLIYNILNTKEFENTKIRIMPDCHSGKGIVIGFTAPLTNFVNPSHVGVDIGCTIDTYITDAKINKDEFALIEHRVKNKIPFGFNINETRIFEMKDFMKFLRTSYNKARSTWNDMILDFDISEKGITEMLKRINMDEGVFYKSIGSVGGGNHFIEFGDYNGYYAFTIHCGSRNFGNKVCRYWEKIASSNQVDNKKLKEAIKKIRETTENRHEIPEKIKEATEYFKSLNASNGYLTGDNMKGYITDMVIATAYSLYNHKIIANEIQKILKKINNAKIIEVISSTHNYIDFNDHIIRKGAIRAYEGEKMIVPFNMRDGLAICVGKSNSDWNCSCAHGAGRKMSRSKAKELLNMDEFKDEMKNVYSTSVCKNTLDEAPMAYKDTSEIKELISETCEIVSIIKPIINIKATDECE